MIYIINDSQDPYFNLASEEYIMNTFHVDEKYLMLWQNQPESAKIEPHASRDLF